jgi:hypothetical protein
MLYHIDVYSDYLAMAGVTSDGSLTGLTSGPGYPFIAVTSVAIPDTYYWAKILSLKIDTKFFGAQFSNDGTILIAHSNEFGFIIAFNA